MVDEVGSGKENRQFFRLRYPAAERPKLIIEGENIHKVIDISERGIRIYYDASVVVNPVRATITFREREPISVRGNVVWIKEGEIALYLTKGIPVEIVESEQEYLKEQYGISFQDD